MAKRRRLTMTPEEQEKRMRRLRESLAENNVYRWAGKLITTLLKIELPERKESAAMVDSPPPRLVRDDPYAGASVPRR